MNEQEATSIIKILMKADKGCVTCVTELLKLFNKEFPGYEDLMKELWGRDPISEGIRIRRKFPDLKEYSDE